MDFNSLKEIKATISASILAGQSQVIVNGFEVFLPTLKPDTQKKKEIEAEKKASQIIDVIYG